jgi:hypothetical protein
VCEWLCQVVVIFWNHLFHSGDLSLAVLFALSSLEIPRLEQIFQKCFDEFFVKIIDSQQFGRRIFVSVETSRAKAVRIARRARDLSNWDKKFQETKAT